jgi:hypothetical protein
VIGPINTPTSDPEKVGEAVRYLTEKQLKCLRDFINDFRKMPIFDGYYSLGNGLYLIYRCGQIITMSIDSSTGDAEIQDIYSSHHGQL